jgi:SET domain-containing protein
MRFQIPEETWINPKIKIRESPGKGKGMFAEELISKGEKVMVWGGKWGMDYMNKKEAEKASKAGKLIMQWDDDLFSAETRGDSEGYFINHSCNPNTWMVDAFTHVARRDIKPGEEVNNDYALMEADENFVANWECGCGSKLCRGRFIGRDWRLPELQMRYKGHFSPLINKRIENLR